MSHVQTLIACALVALIVWNVQQVRVLDARMETVQAREKLAIAQAASIAQARKREREWQAQADAIAHLDNIGIVFGSAGGRGHGVYASAPCTVELAGLEVLA